MTRATHPEGIRLSCGGSVLSARFAQTGADTSRFERCVLVVASRCARSALVPTQSAYHAHLARFVTGTGGIGVTSVRLMRA